MINKDHLNFAALQGLAEINYELSRHDIVLTEDQENEFLKCIEDKLDSFFPDAGYPNHN